MNVADLFINLGVSGTDKTTHALDDVKKGLKETSSMAFETKAAIAALLYGFDKLFAASGQKGTDLVNFNAITGTTVETLQRYQHAALTVGASNEEVASSFGSISESMMDVVSGIAKAPEGLANIADKLKIDITDADIREFSKHPEKFIQLMQEYAKAETDPNIRHLNLKTMPGMNPKMEAAVTRQAFTPKALSEAPMLTGNEAKRLDEARAGIDKIKEKAFVELSKYLAKNGPEIVKGIGAITDAVIKLVEAFGKILTSDTVIKGISQEFKNWVTILEYVTEMLKMVQGIKELGLKKTAYYAMFGTPAEQEAQKQAQHVQDVEDQTAAKVRDRAKAGKPIPAGFNKYGYPKDMDSAESVSRMNAYENAKTKAAEPKKTAAPAAGASINVNKPVVAAVIPMRTVAKPASLPPVQNKTVASITPVTVNQTNNFNHDGREIARTSSDLKKAAQDAGRQISSQARVT